MKILQSWFQRNNLDLQKLFDGMPDALVVVNKNSTITHVNKKLCSLFGYEFKEIEGRKIELLIPSRFHPTHPRYRNDYIKNPHVRSMGKEQQDLFALRKDGSEFPVEVSLSPVTIGNEDFFIAFISDITEKKKQREELERSNKELEQFAYIASHDLQEPLRMVGSYLQLLERRYEDKLDADAKEFIGFAVDGAKRMQVMINDLLMYSRIGRKEKIENVSSDMIVETVTKDFQILINDNDAEITWNDLPIVYADKMQVIHLFQNFISNAIKFRRKDPPIVQITAEMQDENWLFSITDNGIGLKEEYKDKIFVMFQRLQDVRTPGSGIGLAVCKKIIQRYDCNVWVESVLGHGSTFYFTLPVGKE